MPTPKARLTVTATIGALALKVQGGTLRLDDSRAPYCEARLTVQAPAAADLELIDPRVGQRIVVVASLTWDEPVRAPQSRTFNLRLHERSIQHEAGTLLLIGESDEADLIDYVRIATTSARTYGLSVKDAVTAVLTPFGYALQAGAADATLTGNPLTPDVVNQVPNPDIETNATNLSSTSSNTTVARSTVSPIRGTASLRVTTIGAAGVGGFGVGSGVSGAGSVIAVTAGDPFTFACVGRCVTTSRTATPNVRFFNAANVQVGADIAGAAVALPTSGAGARIVISGVVPAGATKAAPFVALAALVNGNLADFDDIMFTATAAPVDYFDGSTLPAGLDPGLWSVTWSGTAHASTSTLKNLPNSDATIWEPGESAWSQLSTLLDAGALRLFCDEGRLWRLVDDSFAVAGLVSISQGTNAVSGEDLISLQSTQSDGSPVWASGVLVRYTWTDALGVAQVAYDAAGQPEHAFFITIEKAYPGPGAAQAYLDAYQGRGRVQTAVALVDLAVTPGQDVVLTMPATNPQSGIVSAVQWAFAADSDDHGTMQVETRGLLEIPPNAWSLAAGPWSAATGSWAGATGSN